MLIVNSMSARRYKKREAKNVLKGLLVGAIAGAAASAAMNLYQRACGRYLLGDEETHGAQSLQKGSPRHGAGEMLRERGVEDPSDDSAERLAQTISVGVLEHELTPREKDLAGTAFHYAYGVSMGAVYGAAAEAAPVATAGAGMPYGALIWLGADEMAVPALGLSKSSFEYSPSINAAALAAHLVYGVVLESVRRSVRHVL
jgi:hypothetical protein